MKITRIRTQAVVLPLDRPVGSSIHHFDKIGFLLVHVEAGGIEGQGFAFTLNGARLDVIDPMVHSLAPLVLGNDVDDSEAVWASMWRDVNFFGQQGLSIFAMSAIDMAIWDLRGKLANRSVARLLGRRRETIPAYASGGLYLSRGKDELASEAVSLVDKGFRCVKVRVGNPDLREDVERVRIVRDAVGPAIGVMIDANQGLGKEQAIRLGRELEEADLTWFEEPVLSSDRKAAAAVAASLDVPVASGETEYARLGFRDLIDAGAAEIVMPDLMRVGGVSEFVKVAHYAEFKGLPVSPHLFPEHSAQLAGALSNISLLEHVPWFSPLFEEQLDIKDGMVTIPDRPGFGFTFAPEIVSRFGVSLK
jgi:L-alanine-DL-glutamate epimerase-like enolase superfamily enzyme